MKMSIRPLRMAAAVDDDSTIGSNQEAPFIIFTAFEKRGLPPSLLVETVSKIVRYAIDDWPPLAPAFLQPRLRRLDLQLPGRGRLPNRLPRSDRDCAR